MFEVSYLKPHSVGQLVPDSVHAMCCSLPTMRDVIGYEERSPETMLAVRSGYPRFVEHHYVLHTGHWIQQQQGLADQVVYVVVSMDAAQMLIDYVGVSESHAASESDFVYVAFAGTEDRCLRAKRFLQHTGLAISSRQAEDYLIAQGELAARQEERVLVNDAAGAVDTILKQYIRAEEIHLARSGMTAFYSALQATRQVQRERGKKIYLQLGWLYLDTQRVLEEFLAEDEQVITLYNVFDKTAIETVFAEQGAEIAAVITELPTNPLVQTLDVVHLSKLALEHGAIRIFDPALVSVANVNVLPYTDVLVASLTKYAANAGDVMMGALAVNPQSVFAQPLMDHIKAGTPAPYHRDLQRLAAEIQDLPAVIEKINANTVRLAGYLEQHPSVAQVHWAYSDSSRNNYQAIACGADRPGSIITIELAMPLTDFYDRSHVVKGPSFGTRFTMMCPFMYLAHYQEVTNEANRARLRSLGINPDLVRISVGTEPYDEIVKALDVGLSV